MKIGERHWEDDGKLIIEETHDFNPILDSAEVLPDQRDLGGPQIADGKHVARLPMKLVAEKARERGVAWNDHEGMQKVVQEMIQSNEYAHFRIWGGRL